MTVKDLFKYFKEKEKDTLYIDSEEVLLRFAGFAEYYGILYLVFVYKNKEITIEVRERENHFLELSFSEKFKGMCETTKVTYGSFDSTLIIYLREFIKEVKKNIPDKMDFKLLNWKNNRKTLNRDI